MRTIKYNVSYEKMITRIPGLFAYLESDNNGNFSLHSATDSINGCYGKIVENIKLPCGCGLSVIEDDNLVIIFQENKTYTFRTIISAYYQYRDELDDNNNNFRKFIETGIGKVKVPQNIRFYIGYVNITNNNEILTEEEYNSLSISKQKYYRKKKLEYVGIPNFIYLSNVKELYNNIVKMGKQCAFYETHKENFGEDSQMCCLCEKYHQMGGKIFEDFLKEQIPCAEEIASQYLKYAQDAQNERPMTLDFDIDLVNSYEDVGIMTPYIPQWIPYKKYYIGERVLYENQVYICIKDNNGLFDEEYQRVIFDYSKWIKPNKVFEEFDDDLKPRQVIKPIEIKGKTDSKLKSLRRFATYLNLNNEGEMPEEGYDWLFYYRKGLIANITMLNDDLGNVIDLYTNTAADDSQNENLAVYGDIIDDIITDTENNSITFIYRIGVHLIGEDYSSNKDEDGNIIHYWGNFIADNSIEFQKSAIKYEETYFYESGSDLEKLIKGNFTIDDLEKEFTFDDYITGKLDDNLKYFKFEFITYNSDYFYNKRIANQEVNIVSIQTDFTMYNTDNDEFMEVTSLEDENFNNKGIPMFRQDYFNGITYSPTNDIDVHIERGLTSIFDKHIRFSEIKTIEDMTEYSNGAFFKMTQS